MASNTDTDPGLPWAYNGLWGLLSSVFCVPREAPALPSIDDERIVARKPSPGFMRYMKFQYWVGISIALLAMLVVSTIVAIAEGGWALVATLAVFALVLVGALIGYLAVHLRFDTTWYVFSDRSMRLRRGLWMIRESTITFENIQNVKVTQGPLQRLFGIANVVVETAGGGNSAGDARGGLTMHAGLIEGVADAGDIRNSILSHVRSSQSAGLGDDVMEPLGRFDSPKHTEVLREIRDLAHHLASDSG